MRRKFLSIITALALVVSMAPTTVFAQAGSIGDGSEANPWQIGATVTNDGSTEPTGVVAEGSYWDGVDVAGESTLTCALDEHDCATAGCEREQTSVACALEGHPNDGSASFVHEDGTACAFDGSSWLTSSLGEYACSATAHTHTDSCYTTTPGYTVWTLKASAEPAVAMLAASPQPSSNDYEAIYSKTSTFDHIDIRVKGTLKVNGVSQDVTIANPVINLDNNGDGSFESSKSFNSSTSYEWRWTGLRVSKNATIQVEFDVKVGDQTVGKYDQTFSGKDAFVQAIANCDMTQGLDFYVSAEQVIQEVFFGVDYVWTVQNDDGSLNGALTEELKKYLTVPASVDGLAEGYDYAYDTEYIPGEYVIVPHDGTDYELRFSGWTEFSQGASEERKQIDSSTITITDDTTIYGVWTFSEAKKANAHIVLTKDVTGAFEESESYLMGRYFRITYYNDNDNDNGTLDVDFTEMTLVKNDSHSYLTYDLPVLADGTYAIAEHNVGVAGYSCETKVTATAADDYGSNFTPVADNPDKTVTIAVTIPEEGGMLGTVAFVNTYEKRYGDPIANATLVVDKQDAITGGVVEGATFALYKGSELISEQMTNESGYAYFENLAPGTYTLVEKAPAEGYVGSDVEYTVKVETIGEGEEQLVGGVFRQVFQTVVSVTVDGVEAEGFFMGEDRGHLVVQNYPEVTVSVIKLWEDEGNEANRPEAVEVVLYRNGEPYGEPVLLNESNEWSHDWAGLSSEFQWTVAEKDVPEGYEASVTAVEDSYFEITNTYVGKSEEPGDPAASEGDSEGTEKSDAADTALPQTGDSLMAIAMTLFALAGAAGLVLAFAKRRQGKQE